MKNDITNLTAFEIAELLRKKKIDPVNLVELFYAKYKDAKTDTKRAISKNLQKEALIEAENSWKRQKCASRLSFFDGIPSGWKDVIDIKNSPAFGGSKVLTNIRKSIKVEDAIVVSNARKKGIIPLFKTSTVEFAFGGLGLNKVVKYPKNQMLNNDLCPGGSSSGSAAAVCANLVPLAVGTDTAGSIRIPSCWHGLVGFKPTFNNISTKGVLPLSKSYDTVGTICKSVKDTTIFYDILAKAKFDHYESKSNCVIGIIHDFITDDLTNTDTDVFYDFVKVLSKKKFNIKKVLIPEFKLVNNIIEDFGGVVNFEAWNYWKSIIRKDIDLIDTNVKSRFLLGKKMSKETFFNIRKKINKIKIKINHYFENFDFLLLPTLSIKPPKIKEVIEKNKYIRYNNMVLGNTRVANLFNLSAITMPINKGKWLSFTILAKEKNDRNLLSIAERIENIIY